MLTWLKNILRRWLADDRPPSLRLECFVTGKTKSRGGHSSSSRTETYFVTGIRGLLLFGTPVGDRGVRLISEGEAVDREHWRRLWKFYGGGGLRWPDGTPLV